MFRDLQERDKDVFLSMVKSFYSSEAVSSPVEPENFEATFKAAMDKSPFMRALMIEHEGKPVGYGLLSFTYSNEVGGMVVLAEELYITEAYRGKGYGREFFAFIEREYPKARRFRLEVMQGNTKAIRLYEKLGYKPLEYRQMVKNI
ncbi:MAG: GNAT family N-acetyltransferase [Clostridiales bacterium]|nr:GNAT family N-acetyltransferase [Clostridiales bacterium]